MSRKIIISLFVVAMLMSMVAVASASDPADDGCYVGAFGPGVTTTGSGESLRYVINEGVNFTTSVNCTNVTDHVFGFQLGTQLTSDPLYTSGPAALTTSATTYEWGATVSDDPNFSDWTDALPGVNNLLSTFALSHQGEDYSVGTFELGNYAITGHKGLVVGANADATATINLINFALSDRLGTEILDDVQASPEANIIIHNLAIALLQTGNVTVQSDGTMQNVSGVTVSLTPNVAGINTDPDGSNSYTNVSTPLSATGANAKAVPVPTQLEYDAADFTAGKLAVDVTASMAGHLTCTSTKYVLVDGYNTIANSIGDNGTVTLLAGDVVSGVTGINIDDASAVGLAFGDVGDNESLDINQDNTIDIFDLVQIGRNYDVTAANCNGSVL